MAEIIDVERFGVDLVHGACGVCHSCHFVGVIFLPPVERSRDIHGYKDLADKLSVVTSSHAETLRKIEIVRSKDKVSVLIIAAVHTSPAVHRVSCAAHGIFKVHDACAFKFYHNVFSPWLKSGRKSSPVLPSTVHTAGCIPIITAFFCIHKMKTCQSQRNSL